MVFDELGFAWLVAQGLRKVTTKVTQNVANRLEDPQQQARVQSMLDKIQDGTEDILSALQSMQEGKIKSAFHHICMGLDEMQGCIRSIQSFHGKLKIPKVYDLGNCQYYHLAQERFKEADKLATEAFYNEKSVRAKMRVDALGIMLYCVIVTHPYDIKHWFHLWKTIFARAFQEKSFIKDVMGRPNGLTDFASPELKQTRERMKQLMESLSTLIFSIVLHNASLSANAQDFITYITILINNTPELKPGGNWKPLSLGTFQASVTGACWFTSDERLGLAGATLPFDCKFMYLVGIQNLTWIKPNLMFGTAVKGAYNAGSLISFDPAVASKYLSTVKGNWEIFGYAEEQGLLYASNDGTMFCYDIKRKSLLSTDMKLPTPANAVSNYIFLIATDGGNILAQNSKNKQRFVHFSNHNPEWLQIDDSKIKDGTNELKKHDQILLHQNKNNYIIRLSLISSADNNLKIQKEKIFLKSSQLSVKSKIFTIDLKVDYPLMTTNVRRLTGKEIDPCIYVVGQVKNGNRVLPFVITKPKVAKIKMQLDKGGRITGFGIEKEYKWEAGAYPEWPGKMLHSITYGDDIIYA